MLDTKSPEFHLAISSVLKAGKIVREIYNTSFEVSWKSKDDPLTEADLHANRIILEQIQTAFPKDGILSEEMADNSDRLDKDRVWILDPIDGTREFVQKNPEFSISLGLSIQTKPMLGIVFNPITRELVSGIVGLGVSYDILDDSLEFDSNRISLRPIDFEKEIEKPFVCVSRSEFYKYKLFDENPFWKESFNLKPVGSIAYKLALTAANKADLSISLKPKSEWDICAGVALIIASGGKAVDLASLKEKPFNEQKPRQEGVLAGNPHIVNRLIKNKGSFFQASIVDWN